MSVIEKLKKEIKNPYKPYQKTNISTDLFIGRRKEIDVMYQFLDDFHKTNTLDNNVIIYGEKSVGKSTLLKRFESILEGTFETYFFDLDKADVKDNREFFEKIISEILYENEELIYQNDIETSIDSKFFEQWEEYRKGENVELARPKQFYLQRTYKSPTAQSLARDFKRLINDLSLMDESINGLVIIIDEAQLLKHNSEIVRNINVLSSEIDNMMFITAGLKELMTEEVFTKLKRNSFPFELLGLEEQEISEAIFKPIMDSAKVTELELLQLFDRESLSQIHDKSSGNPYHIKVICGEMFEHFQNTDIDKLIIDESVIDNVMNIFSSLSTERELIESHLKSYDKDKLEKFAHLYSIAGGYSLYEMVNIVPAYDTFNDEIKEKTLEKIIKTCVELNPLFEVKDYNRNKISYEHIKSEINIDNCPQYTVDFVGDNLDKLFAYYYYNQKTDGQLKSLSKKYLSFEDIMAGILQENLIDKFLNFCIYDNKIISDDDINHQYSTYMSKDRVDWDEKINNFEQLEKFNRSDKNIGKKSANFYHQLKDKSFYKKLAIEQRSESYWGYISINLHCRINNKMKYLNAYIPIIKENPELLKMERINDYKSFFDASLNEYDIDIIDFTVKVIPYTTIIIIYMPIAQDSETKKYELVAEGKFDAAIQHNNYLLQLQPRLLIGGSTSEENPKSEIHNYINDAGFILICKGEYSTARELLNESKPTYLVSRVNIAFIDFMEGKIDESLTTYKKLIRKKKKLVNQQLKFIHLALDHPELKGIDKMVEDVSYNNICCWNSLLILSKNIQSLTDKDIFSKTNNKIVLNNPHEKNIHCRINYWIKYNKGEKENVLQDAKDLVAKLDRDKEKLLFNSVEKDIDIFKKEIK